MSTPSVRFLQVGLAILWGTAATTTRAAGADIEASEPPVALTAPRSALEASLRLGFELPLGDADGGSTHALAERSGKLADLVAWSVPVWLDLEYRLDPKLLVGAFTQLGIGASDDACFGGARCSGFSWRLGAQLRWRERNPAEQALWFGVGLGYEWLDFRRRGVDVPAAMIPAPDPTAPAAPAGPGGAAPPLATVDEFMSGPLVVLQVGLDYPVDGGLRLGPYIAGSAGSYLTRTYDCSSSVPGVTCPSDTIDEKKVHAFVGAGVSGSYTD